MAGRAIILEVKKGVCTVMTPEGQFLRVKMRGDFRPGQEITLPEGRRGYSRLALLAASLILLLAATALWKVLLPPAVAAYVSLEINPAIELALDGKNVVRGVRPLDSGGEELAAGLKLVGLPLEGAVDRVITAAVNKNMIVFEDGVVVSTVTPADNLADPSGLDLLIRNTVEGSLKSRGIGARVLVGHASAEIREKAVRAGIPTGRYMLYLDAARKGVSVEPEALKKKNLVSIEREIKIKLGDVLEVNAGGRGTDSGPRRDGTRAGDGREHDRVVVETGRDQGRDSNPAGSAPGPAGQPGEGQEGVGKAVEEKKDEKDIKDIREDKKNTEDKKDTKESEARGRGLEKSGLQQTGMPRDPGGKEHGQRPPAARGTDQGREGGGGLSRP